MAYSPLARLMKILNKDEENLGNVYDDGSIWTKPETTTSNDIGYISPIKTRGLGGSEKMGLSDLPGIMKEKSQDPLESGRNQMEYYTNKLEELGQEPKKPSIWSKLGGGVADVLTRIGAVPGAVSNTLAGGVGKEIEHSNKEHDSILNDSRIDRIKELGFTPIKSGGVWTFKESTYKDGYDEADKILQSIVKDNSKGVKKRLTDAKETITSAFSSGANTAKGLFTGEYSDKAVDWGKVLEDNRISPNETVSNFVKLIESPGYLASKHIFGADEESAKNWGNIVGDLGISLLEGNITDIDGAGKTIKALRNSDKLDEISKVSKIDDAIKLAKKYNNYDDFVLSLGENASKYSDDVLKQMYDRTVQTYAQDLVKDVNRGLGGIKNFEGLKIGNSVILSPEQISKISKNKVQSALTQVGLGLYSPVGALLNNPITDGISSVVGKTEVGQALSKDINKLFKGGKNNQWINAMKDNPENALKYANERKQVEFAKKLGDDEIQRTMETINKYSDMKESPEEISKIIEEPTTRKTREIKVEKEINNPEYISKMMKLGQNEYNKQVVSLKTMQNKLKTQLDELSSLGKESKANKLKVDGINSEISNIQKRIDRLAEISDAKSIDFNKQMKQFGFKDKDYSEMFNKAISTDIETLTKELGDRNLAEALQESANRVLDTLDSKHKGLSENFVSYGKMASEGSDNFSDFIGEEVLDKAKNLNIKVNLDSYKADKSYRDKIDGFIEYRQRQKDLSSDKLSKNNPVFKDSKFEGSGDVIEDLKKIASMRKEGADTPVMQHGAKYRQIKDELETLKNPVDIDNTKKQSKFRKERIKELEKQLKESEFFDIEDGRKVNKTTGEFYTEVNDVPTEDLEKLSKKLYKEEIQEIRPLKNKIKQYETMGLGYIEDEDIALKLANEIKNKYNIADEVDDIADELMLDGSEYVTKLEKNIKEKYFDDLTNLTSDEIDIIKNELERRKPWSTSANNKINANITEQLDEVEKIKQESLTAEQNISVKGADRNKWLADNEAKRANVRTEYDGNMSTTNVNTVNDLKSREQIANEKQTVAKAEKEFNDKVEADNKAKEEKLRKDELYEEFEANHRKEYAKYKDKTALDKMVKKVRDSKVENLSSIRKELYNKLPDNLKDIDGIKFSTNKGEIIIDKDISNSDLKKILNANNYGTNEVGTRIVYTNKQIDTNGAVGRYYYDSDTVHINIKDLGKKQVNTVLEHEFGHKVLNKIVKSNPDLTEEMITIPFLKYYRNLDDKAKDIFINVVTKANKSNVPTKEMVNLGMVTKYLNTLTKGNADLTTISKEGFAELYSLFNNKNKTVANGMKKVDEKAYNTFIEVMNKYTPEEVVEVSKFVRKRFGDDYANQIIELNKKKESLVGFGDVIKKASEVKNTTVKVEDIKNKLKNLELSMDKHEFDDNGNIISTDYDTFFEEMKKVNPNAVESIDKKVPRYKKLFQMEEKVFEIDNTANLSDEARAYIDEYKNEMKRIALREGIYEEDEAEAFSTYVAHMINPKYSDDAEIIERGRKLKAELQDPLNVYSRTRTKEGTIEELNKLSEAEDGIRIFDENINRIFLKREMDSVKNYLKKSQNDRILEEFSIPIVQNFDKHINSADYFMENFGEQVSNDLGVKPKELKNIFKNSKKTSFEFLKDQYFEEFNKTLPEFKGMKLNDFKKYLEESQLGSSYTGRLINLHKKGKYDELKDVIFEAKYPMTNKFNYARSLMEKYGYDDYFENPLENIPKTTSDGRPYVPKTDFKGDRTKEIPYGIENKILWKSDPIKAYNEFVYKEAKNRNMIIVELPIEEPVKTMKRTITDENMAEAIKDRTTVAERINKLVSGDKEAIEGFDALAGYNVIDPKKISYEEFLVSEGKKRVLIDKSSWENYQKAIKDIEYKEKNALLKVYDKLSNMFKSQAIFSGSFHLRNGIQNIVASYTKTGANLLDPKKNKEAIDMLLYHKGVLKNLDKQYNGYNIDEIMTQAEKSGLFETQLKNEFDKDGVSKFLKGETDKLETVKTPLRKKVNPFSTDFIGYTASRALGDSIENQAKMVNLITHLDNGFNLSDAIQLTKDTLFDYSDLTEFESKVMRRIIPFYTFMRKNIPSQIDNLANSGAKMQRVERVYNKASEKNESDKERALRPDYLDGQFAIGNQKYLNLGNATDDLKKLVSPLDMASGLNPVIKTPIELLFNKQLYSGSDISKFDKPSEKAKYVLEGAVPITKKVSALHKLLTGTEQEQTKAKNTLMKSIGSLVNEYDIEKQEKSTMYDYIEELQNQYYEYLEKHPEAKEELEKKNKLNKSNNNYVSPLSKLIKKR